MRNNINNNNAFNLISQKSIPTIKDAVLHIEIPKAATPESHMSRLKIWSVFITCYLLSWSSVVSLALTLTCINAFLIYSLLYARPAQALIHLSMSWTGVLRKLKKTSNSTKQHAILD